MAHPSKKYLTLIITIAILALFLGLFILLTPKVQPPRDFQTASVSTASITKNTTASTTLTLAGKTIQVRIADTEAKRAQGLSDTTPLGENEGMLFIFDKPSNYHFWMKDMNYALDIIWFDQDQKIVDITANLTSNTYPQTFTSKKPARFVLEVAAGFAKSNNLKIGDSFSRN